MGLTSHRIIGYQEDELQGALIDQLGLIENVEKENSEVELFIMMFNKSPENGINEYIKKGIIRDEGAEAIAEYLIKV